MPKFIISSSETLYYLAQEVEAKNKEEAREKFSELLEGGQIPVVNSERNDTKVKKLN